MAGVVDPRLRRQLRAGRLPHALIFSGSDIEGNLEQAWSFAQSLVCDKRAAGESESACRECGPCRRVESRSSESVLHVAPDGTTIKLESAHQILDFLSLRQVGRARIVIIEQANLLGVQTANALLKVIEEPPPHSYFIMLAQSASQLLPTLRSRSQAIPFAPRPRAEEPEDMQMRGIARQFLRDAFEDTRGSLEQVQAEAKDREVALQFARQMQFVIRDWAAGKTPGLPDVELRRKTDLWRQAFQTEMDILGNVDRALLLENFFYRARHALR